MSVHNTLQVFANEIHLDRPTTHTMWGYVVSLARRNTDGETQVYVSPRSFRVRRDGRSWTKDDTVKRFEGEGVLLFSTAWKQLTTVHLDTYFVRDNKKIRDAGHLMKEILGDDGAAARVAKDLAAALSKSSVAGSVVSVSAQVGAFIGGVVAKRRDRIKVHATGSFRVRDILGPNELEDELVWGRRDPGDKGYFGLSVDRVTLPDPDAAIVPLKFPKAVENKL